MYGKLKDIAGDRLEQLKDASPPPDVDAAELEKTGFAEVVKVEE